MKVGLAFSTKDRRNLSEQSIQPLLDQIGYDLWLIDGSKTEDGLRFAQEQNVSHLRCNVGGGADSAIVYSLTALLSSPEHYDAVGLVENDVVLDADWFAPTMELFEKGRSDGLEVGAVSARSYEDRVLIKRFGYAVMANLGAGMIIFSRRAAEIVLQHFRTGFTTELRRVWMQMAELDFARWSGFVRYPHVCCADWNFDRVLAQHGLASLALTPAKCQMIGQVPSLEEQGLHLVVEGDDLSHFECDKAFETFRERTAAIREGRLKLPDGMFLTDEQGNTTIMPHQVSMLGGRFEGDWQLKWVQGFGPFAWKAGNLVETYAGHGNVLELDPSVSIPISGPCSFLVSGGDTGGKIHIADEASGYEMSIDVRPESNGWMNVTVPGNIAYRNVRLTALTPGIVFHAIVTREPQPVVPGVRFDHSQLPLP